MGGGCWDTALGGVRCLHATTAVLQTDGCSSTIAASRSNISSLPVLQRNTMEEAEGDPT